MSNDKARVIHIGLNYAIPLKTILRKELVCEIEAAIRTIPALEAERLRQEIVPIQKNTKPTK